MKQIWKHILAKSLPAFLILAAAGCGSGNSVSELTEEKEPEAAPAETANAEVQDNSGAGKYNALGVRLDDYIVKTDSVEGNYLDLAEDGSGYLYFGDDNQGDITSWDAGGKTFTMKAGVSEFTGTLENGILDLSFGDDLIITFAKEGSDTSSLKIMTLDEYKEARQKESSSDAGSESDPAGDYTAYAVETQGIVILLPEEDRDAFAFTLNEDGTGTVSADGDSEAVIWKLDGEKLTFYETTGELASGDYEITLKDGIMTFYIPPDGEDDEIIEYLVKDGADTSKIDANAVAPSTLN